MTHRERLAGLIVIALYIWASNDDYNTAVAAQQTETITESTPCTAF